MMPATRAVAKASPLGSASPNIASSTAGFIVTTPEATASRAVIPFADTSTIAASPEADRWDSGIGFDDSGTFIRTFPTATRITLPAAVPFVNHYGNRTPPARASGRPTHNPIAMEMMLRQAIGTGGEVTNAGGDWATHVVAWFVGARSHRVLCLIAGIWLLNGFDLALTIMAHQQGLLSELNPLARRLLVDGPVWITLYKVGLVLIGTYPLIRFRTSRIAEMGALCVLLVYALLAVHWNTCYELYTLAHTNNVNWAEVQAIDGAWNR